MTDPDVPGTDKPDPAAPEQTVKRSKVSSFKAMWSSAVEFLKSCLMLEGATHEATRLERRADRIAILLIPTLLVAGLIAITTSDPYQTSKYVIGFSFFAATTACTAIVTLMYLWVPGRDISDYSVVRGKIVCGLLGSMALTAFTVWTGLLLL